MGDGGHLALMETGHTAIVEDTSNGRPRDGLVVVTQIDAGQGDVEARHESLAALPL